MVLIKHINVYFIFALCYMPGILLLVHQQHPILPEINRELTFFICIGYWFFVAMYVMSNIDILRDKKADAQKFKLILSASLLIFVFILHSAQFSYQILTARYLHSEFVDFILLFISASLIFVIFYYLHYLSIKLTE